MQLGPPLGNNSNRHRRNRQGCRPSQARVGFSESEKWGAKPQPKNLDGRNIWGLVDEASSLPNHRGWPNGKAGTGEQGGDGGCLTGWDGGIPPGQTGEGGREQQSWMAWIKDRSNVRLVDITNTITHNDQTAGHQHAGRWRVTVS